MNKYKEMFDKINISDEWFLKKGKKRKKKKKKKKKKE